MTQISEIPDPHLQYHRVELAELQRAIDKRFVAIVEEVSEMDMEELKKIMNRLNEDRQPLPEPENCRSVIPLPPPDPAIGKIYRPRPKPEIAFASNSVSILWVHVFVGALTVAIVLLVLSKVL